MTLTARSLTTHEMAAEAALSRLQRRWAREGKVPFDAQLDVVAALLPVMLDMAITDTADIFAELPPPSIVADASPLGLLAQAILGPSIRSRLAMRASAIADELQRGYTPATIARNEVAGVRTAATSAVATYAAPYVTAEVVWHSSPDCVHDACLSMNGERVAYGQPFSNGASAPPVHRNCRCRSALEITPLSVTAAGDVNEPVTDSVRSSHLTAAADGPGWLAVVAIYGRETPDHRLVEKGGLKWRTLPLPLTWCEAGNGHDGDVVVGQITEMWEEGDEVRARGTWDTSPTAMEARRVVDSQLIRWVSMVHDEPRAWELRQSPENCAEVDPDEPIDLDTVDECIVTYVVLDADVAKLAIVDHPAFPGCVIVPGDVGIPALTEHGRPAATPADVPAEVVALAACAAIAAPPASWFDDPCLTSITPITVDEDGHIYGHFAPDVDHIAGHGRPPRGTDYDSAFHLHAQPTAEGHSVKVGLVIGGVGHPNDVPRSLSVAEAQRYYAGPGAIVTARVRVGEDDHGIWMSGAVAPDLDDSERAQLRALKFSGDWRRKKGTIQWSLVAIASGILVPGYPDGQALVAAGSETCLLLASS